MKRITLLIIVIILISPVPSRAEDKMRIAVLDLTAQGVNPRTAQTVSEMLRTELVNIGKFTVVERGQMENILKEQGFQRTGCTDQECAVQIGKLMSARKMLLGAVSPLGPAIIINVRIVDVEKGVVEFAAKEKSDSEAGLDAAVESIARKLADKIGVSAKEFSEAKRGPEIKKESGLAEHQLIAAITPVYLMPIGNFSDVVSSGAGVLVNVSMENVFFNRLRIGISTGYCYLSGANDKVDNSYMVPGLAVISRSYPISGQFSILPEISAGIEYSSVKYVKKNNEASTKSAVEPLFMAGFSVEYSFTNRIALQAGVNYGIILETSGMMNFVMAKAGVLFRL